MAATVADKRESALGDALKALWAGKRLHSTKNARGPRITARQLFRLVHRLVIVSTAIYYLIISIQSAVVSVRLLRGARNDPVVFAPYTTTHILDWVGSSTIRTSPLVTELLQNDTMPRDYALYLEANKTTSTTKCTTPNFNLKLYNKGFLHGALQVLQRDVAYHLPDLAAYECVVPVVDCSSTPLVRGLTADARLFYVMRNVLDAEDVVLVSLRLSMQDFRVFETKEIGPVGLASVEWVRDMSARSVLGAVLTGGLGFPFEPAVSYVYTPPALRPDGWLLTTVIPPTPLIAPRRVVTSRRTGFYIAADTEQANILEQYSVFETSNPRTTLSQWTWHGEPLVMDSWAWVHFVHVYFAFTSLINLGVLFLVVYRNVQRGRVWFGDAFVSVSNTLFARGPVILATWVLNGFWALMEFCLHDAHTIAETQTVYLQENIMRADLLTLFLAVTAIVGHALRERIDPVFAIVAFEVAFQARLSILKGFPSVVKKLTDFAVADLNRSVVKGSDSPNATPLQLWTTRKIAKRDGTFIVACFLPYFLAIGAVVLFVVARKTYRHFYHDKIYIQHNTRDTGTGTAASQSDESTLVLFKRNLTLFEVATGVELQSRYGVVSEYENFLFIKGLKYASADGIYSSGFVIANDKFLIAASDYLAIAIQKLTKLRLRNVYVYIVDGNTVQQRAQLVYANTLTWNDLLHPNVTVLS